MLTYRDAVPTDYREIGELTREATVFAGEHLLAADESAIEGCFAANHEVRVAESEEGILGVYSLWLLRSDTRVQGELDLFLTADRHGRHGVARFLLQDLRLRAASRNIGSVCVLVRPPKDSVFRSIGARPVVLLGPSGTVTWPRLVLEIAI